MDKQQAIIWLKRGHRKLEKVISSLNEEQMTRIPVLGKWTVKDIIAHLIAWNWEAAKEIERILNNKATWHKLFEETSGENKFNEIEVKKRKDKNFNEAIQDWEESFQHVIKEIEALSLKEWNHQSGKDTWEDGSPLTIASLFDYEYEGDEHEGGHANQVIRFFKLPLDHR